MNVTAEGLQSIELIDMMGRVISQTSASQPTTTIDLADIPSGIYFLRITTEAGVTTQRLEVKSFNRRKRLYLQGGERRCILQFDL